MIRTCETCKYTTKVKSSYDNHLKSKRHQTNLINKPKYECFICNNIFITQSGLYKHKRLCIAKKQTSDAEKIKEISEFREKIREEVSEELREKIKEEVSEEIRKEVREELRNEIITELNVNNMNITNNNNTTNNNHIHIYLNTHCNDAPNILDAIKKLEFTENDFREITNRSIPLNLAMYNLFEQKLTELPMEQRSLHCVPSALFVRDENQWKEENPTEVKHQIEDVESFDDDTDMEDVPVEMRPGIKKMIMTKTTELFGDKVYDSCEHIFTDKKKLDSVLTGTRIGSNCTNRAFLVENTTKSNKLLITPSTST
uniref:C2H2-type domain-containing protein n=1 Tax=viral metagenome TaxID=1070528 RepID=A0A6C0IAW8_9ZZZZ